MQEAGMVKVKITDLSSNDWVTVLLIQNQLMSLLYHGKMDYFRDYGKPP